MDDKAECAICFESVARPTLLPCACKISYCFKCWDRALASSLSSGDQARCPTCRGPVRVDFDPIECQLMFAQETDNQDHGNNEADNEGLRLFRQQLEQRFVDVGSDPRTPENASLLELRVQRFRAERQAVASIHRRQATIERLASQASPAMVRKLHRYHARNADSIARFIQNPAAALVTLPDSDVKEQIGLLGGSVDGCLEKADLVQRLVDVAGESSTLACFLISASLNAPECVCGGALERVSSMERLRRYLLKLGCPPGRVDEEVQRRKDMGRGTSMVCDICDGKVTFGMSVWTCKNTDSTVLHAATYDICEGCFSCHACSGDSPGA